VELLDKLLERPRVYYLAGAAVAIVAAVVLAVVLLASDSGADEGSDLEPRIEPPAIGEAGVLRVGVDMDYPPFAGEDKEQVVGLDVDVAAAVAEALGLRLELVDVAPDGLVEALDGGDVDIALGATPITDSVLADVSFAGSYVEDGPAYFSATETSVTPRTLAGKRIGAQEGAAAYWLLQSLYGEGVVTGFPTLREAIVAAEAGELDVVAGDAIVGAYIARDHPSVRHVGPIEDSVPLGVAVAKDNDDLETAVREILDRLAADGVLEAIELKWTGAVGADAAGSSDATPTAQETDTAQ
jgi:polar amino acid transport system substrate-binding protein